MSEGDPAAGGTAARAGNRVIGEDPNTITGDPAPSLDAFGWPRASTTARAREILPIPPGRKRPVMRGWQHFETTVLADPYLLATLGDVRETSKAAIAAGSIAARSARHIIACARAGPR
jgi:hypothetical protein